MSDEVWAEVREMPGFQVSSHGRVRSHRGHIMKPGLINSGYLKVDMRVRGEGVTRTVHRLVAEAFVPNPDGNPEVNHKDSNKSNNRWDNLEWVSRQENVDHAKGGDAWSKATWRTSTTGLRGVTPHVDGGFIARVTHKGVREYLGYFSCAQSAAQAVASRRELISLFGDLW